MSRRALLVTVTTVWLITLTLTGWAIVWAWGR